MCVCGGGGVSGGKKGILGVGVDVFGLATLHIDTLLLRPVSALHLTWKVWKSQEPAPHLLPTAPHSRPIRATDKQCVRILAGFGELYGRKRGSSLTDYFFLARRVPSKRVWFSVKGSVCVREGGWVG